MSLILLQKKFGHKLERPFPPEVQIASVTATPALYDFL